MSLLSNCDGSALLMDCDETGLLVGCGCECKVLYLVGFTQETICLSSDVGCPFTCDDALWWPCTDTPEGNIDGHVPGGCPGPEWSTTSLGFCGGYLAVTINGTTGVGAVSVFSAFSVTQQANLTRISGTPNCPLGTYSVDQPILWNLYGCLYFQTTITSTVIVT